MHTLNLQLDKKARFAAEVSAVHRAGTHMIWGFHKSLIKAAIWVNIFFCALIVLKKPHKILQTLSRLKQVRDDARGKHRILKYTKAGFKYYYSMNAPGWPSRAFSRYIINQLHKTEYEQQLPLLDTVIFGITKKCGYRCEHCFEWQALNKPESLTRENLLQVIKSFQEIGVTQVQLSGGEPLNRIGDIVYLLRNINKGTEIWLYTSGYHFTEERAALLKKEGLAGIIVSLDHWIPEKHDLFRGKKNAFDWAERAVANAVKHRLIACLSLCATKEFISDYNFTRYAELARTWGISFIQVLEPEAVGHYAGKDVEIDMQQINCLENFYTGYNYSKDRLEYPAILYHGFYNRRIGCGGGGKYYAYVDTDGDVHNCTFCRKKLFSALHDPIGKNLMLMKNAGCNAFLNTSKIW